MKVIILAEVNKQYVKANASGHGIFLHSYNGSFEFFIACVKVI